MAAVKYLLVIMVAVVVSIVFKSPAKQLPLHVNGTVHPKFASIEQLFRDVLLDEREGAALAVYQEGRLVVDMWGGYADSSALRRWERDTMTVVYSSTKSVTALVMAMLVNRGRVSYDHLISRYWPQFAKHGKDNITVAMLLNHQAGLISLDGELTPENVEQTSLVSEMIENTRPVWPAGTQTGYHAVSFGWLVDQLVRRVDSRGRGVSQFYQDEIKALSNENDFYIGLPKELNHRVARITNPRLTESIVGNLRSGRLLFETAYQYSKSGHICEKAVTTPSFLSVLSDEITYNDPKIHQLAQAAVSGIGTARGLANVFVTMLRENLVSRSVLQTISAPVVDDMDLVMLRPLPKGHGFFHSPHPIHPNKWLIGHPGNGGQCVEFDVENDVVIAFVRNGLKPGLISMDTYTTLRNAVFAVIAH